MARPHIARRQLSYRKARVVLRLLNMPPRQTATVDGGHVGGCRILQLGFLLQIIERLPHRAAAVLGLYFCRLGMLSGKVARAQFLPLGLDVRQHEARLQGRISTLISQIVASRRVRVVGNLTDCNLRLPIARLLIASRRVRDVSSQWWVGRKGVKWRHGSQRQVGLRSQASS